MLSGQMSLKLSPYSDLYDIVVSKDNILRKIKENVDFSFVNGMVADSYCADFGRPAKEPEMMFKLLFLKTWFDLSDRQLIENARVNMAYKYFLDLNPEDEMVDASLLSVFRKTHINGEDMMDEMIGESIRQAIEKGVIKSSSIIVDATHTNSKANKETPTQQLRRLTKNVRKEIYRTAYELHTQFPEKPDETATLDEEITYTEKLIEVVNRYTMEHSNIKVEKQITHIKGLLDNRKIETIQSAVDEDAKTGHKSKDDPFFGYKTHIAMTQDRLITAAEVTSGEVNDSTQLTTLIEKSTEAGICVDEVLGDKAYSSQTNIDYMNKNKIRPITRKRKYSLPEINEEKGFVYNKDSDTFACKAGHLAKSKKFKRRKKVGSHINNAMEYQFDVEKCKKCPYREGCYKPGAKTKTYTVTIPEDHKDPHLSFEETEYFNKRIKERYKIEAKNGELKQAHGFDRCKYMGLSGMKLQTGLSVFVVNIKRILKLMEYQIG